MKIVMEIVMEIVMKFSENCDENHVNHVIQAVPCALMIDIAASVGKLTKYLFKNTTLSLSCV